MYSSPYKNYKLPWPRILKRMSKSHGSNKAMCQGIFHMLSRFREITINLYMPELRNTFYPSRVSEMGFNGPKKYTPPINSYLW